MLLNKGLACRTDDAVGERETDAWSWSRVGLSRRRFLLFEPLSRRNRNRPTFAYRTHLAVALLVSCSIARQFAGGLEVKQK